MQLESITDLNYRMTRLMNIFDYKSEDVLQREVSYANKSDFARHLNKMLILCNELKFITIDGNQRYANDLFNLINNMYVGVNRLFYNKGTNEAVSEIIKKNGKDILDYLYLIENNEADFKDFVFTKETPFDEDYFIEFSKKISVDRNRKGEDILIFQDELNGGEVLKNIERSILDNNPDEKILLYGIDKNVYVGKESREKGIFTARKGLAACSSTWADIVFSTTNETNTELVTTIDYLTGQNSNYYRTHNRRLLKKNGLFIFNIPFYKIPDFEKTLKSLVIEQVIYTGDMYGNVVFVLRNALSLSNNEVQIKKATFMPDTLPKEFEPISLFSDVGDKPQTFRANFIDIDDVEHEFANKEKSSNFIFDYFNVTDTEEESIRSLQEPKEGHIPTLATSGIVSGRYVDEVLLDRIGVEMGFDNIIETKIVKKEIEEEEMVSFKGEMVKEVSLKKSNIIISTALSPSGEFIELFSNSTEENGNE